MKKVMMAAMAAGILAGGNAGAYELATSAYLAAYAPDYVKSEVAPEGYAKNYLNPTFIAGVADAFDRHLDSDVKSERDAFGKRTLDAVLGFHKKAVEGGEGRGIFSSGTNFGMRISNLIDFLVIPILTKSGEKVSLNDYSTRIRKEAIDEAKGKVWAGGYQMATVWMPGQGYDSSGRANMNPVNFPASVKGVQYNSFASELLTIFQDARSHDVEIAVLEQLEKVQNMSYDEIEKAVGTFNLSTVGHDGLKHPVRECYGFHADQSALLLKAIDYKNVSTSEFETYEKETLRRLEKQITNVPARFGENWAAAVVRKMTAQRPEFLFSSRCGMKAGGKALAPQLDWDDKNRGILDKVVEGTGSYMFGTAKVRGMLGY